MIMRKTWTESRDLEVDLVFDPTLLHRHFRYVENPPSYLDGPSLIHSHQFGHDMHTHPDYDLPELARLFDGNGPDEKNSNPLT